MALTKITGEGVGDLDTLTVDGVNVSGIATIQSDSPELHFIDSTNSTDAIIRSNNNGDIVLEADENAERDNTIIRFDVDGSEKMRIDSSGSTFFNCTSAPSASVVGSAFIKSAYDSQLQLSGSLTTGNNIVEFYNPNGRVGSIATNGSATAYNTSSDYRLKENVTYDWDATTRLKQLKPARFNFITDTDTTVDGFLAHEAQAVVPEAVTGTHNEVEVWKEGEELPDGVSVGDNKLDSDGNTIPVMQGIDQSKLVPLLVKTLQEAITKIETLEAKVQALEDA